ncbi:MAG TPA: tetratricopeptide repeat protein [Pyrinomonadaceae bacterium]
MKTRNRIGAATLAAALLLAPLTPALTNIVMARTLAPQDSDVPSDAEQAMFTKGQNLYTQGRFDQAASVLQDFLKTYPKSIITDLTLLWLGRAYMQLGKIPDAEQIGQRLRSIKDTPFADIYDNELQAARREAPSRARTTPSPANPPSTNPSVPPTLISSPSPSPSPTPRRTDFPTNPVTTNPNANTNRTPANTALNNSNANSKSNTRLMDTTSPGVSPADSTANVNANKQPNRGRDRRANQAKSNAPTLTINNSNQATQPIKPPTRDEQVAVKTPPRNTNTVRPTTTNNSNASAPVTNPTTNPITPPSTFESSSGVDNTSSSASSSSGLNIVVKQVPNLLLALKRSSEVALPGQTVQLPLTITNTGNKADQFRLETDLPAEYQPTFSLAQGGTDTGLPILVTPQLAQNSSVDVLLNLRVPETATDGQQRRFFVRAASQADYQVLKVTDGAINVVAPALAATSDVSQQSVMPGETFTQTITVKNTGSSAARSSRADFVFNPNFELVNASPSPIAYDRASRTAIWSLGDLGGRDSRDITVTLKAVPNALATSNSLGRGTLRTQSLPVASNFDSPSISVGKVPKARIDAVSAGLTATPGDMMFVPFVVRNPGNTSDSYELRITSPGAPPATIYADTNADGQHQESELAVTTTAALDPQGGQFPMLLGVRIPANTPDRQQFSYSIVARSLTSNRVASEANTVLTVATPRVRVRTEQVTDSSAPGDTIYYRLVLVNEGSGLAKNLSVVETLPDALQFVNSEPSLNTQDAPNDSQRFTWRVPELAPGDTAVLRIAVRLRQNLQAETNLTTRHTLSYQDSNNNSYAGQ